MKEGNSGDARKKSENWERKTGRKGSEHENSRKVSTLGNAGDKEENKEIRTKLEVNSESKREKKTRTLEARV